MQLRSSEKKIKNLKDCVNKAALKTKEICSIYSNFLAYRSPNHNDTLYLLEKHLLLKVKAIESGQLYEFKNLLDFIITFHKHDEYTHYLLCELYMHNSFLEEHVEENVVPFIGDIQFEAFISFARN